jgi:hypothetical protein
MLFLCPANREEYPSSILAVLRDPFVTIGVRNMTR